jgi:ComEC/Rec2-related protein
MLKHPGSPFSTYIVVGLAIGICFFNFKIGLLLFILSSLIAFIYQKISPINFNLLLISMLAGYYLYHRQTSIFHDFKNKINHKTFDVTGLVVDYEKTPGNLFKHKLTIQTTIFSNLNEKINCTKCICIYTQRFPAAYVGDEILLENLRFNFASNNHFEQFLIKNNIAGTVFMATLNFKKITKQTTCAATFLKKYKRAILKKINLKMNYTTAAMFNSIFLGNKSCNKLEIAKLKRNFQTWGIIHYLARSGLHLVIISAIWQVLCNILQIPFILSNVIVVLFMIIFCFLSWSALPFTRALVMILCYRICRFWRLQIHMLHILNISCIITLVCNPASLFALDFQLSFLLTYGLVFFNEILFLKK